MSVIPTRLLNKNSPLSDLTIDQMLLIHGVQPTIKSALPPRKPGTAYTDAERREIIATRTSQPNPDNKPYIPGRHPRALTPIIEQNVQAVVQETAAIAATTLEAKSKHKNSQNKGRGRSTGGLTNSRGTTTPNRSAAPVGSSAPPSSSRPGSATSAGSGSPPTRSLLPTPGRPAPGKAHVLVSPTPDAPPEISMNEPCPHVMELVFEVSTPYGEMTVAYPMYCEVLGRHPNQPHMMRVYGRSQDPDDPDQDVFVGWGDVQDAQGTTS